MKLTLDTQSVRSLIKDNEAFEVELRQCVINNIRDDILEKALTEKINSHVNSMCENVGNYYSPKWQITDKRFLEMMREVVKETVASTAHATIKLRIEEMIQQEQLHMRKELGKLVTEIAKDALTLAITPEIAREIMIKKLI